MNYNPTKYGDESWLEDWTGIRRPLALTCLDAFIDLQELVSYINLMEKVEG